MRIAAIADDWLAKHLFYTLKSCLKDTLLLGPREKQSKATSKDKDLRAEYLTVLLNVLPAGIGYYSGPATSKEQDKAWLFQPKARHQEASLEGKMIWRGSSGDGSIEKIRKLDIYPYDITNRPYIMSTGRALGLGKPQPRFGALLSLRSQDLGIGSGSGYHLLHDSVGR
ncbi:hypothetical protein VM1G_11299 [Cytospora mali]|uniref:Uncharacterized protein n=1 Tax=Cytospora mali TaxID=578113 RepID=A0A194VKY9_CYTMA|nr:hypothetical protein VM1G_11299 [Valsa mali]